MERPDYNFPKWKKIIGYTVLGLMIITDMAMPSSYTLWVNSAALLVLLIMFFPIIPESFRQGCNSFGYYAIALAILATMLLIGGPALLLLVKPSY